MEWFAKTGQFQTACDLCMAHRGAAVAALLQAASRFTWHLVFGEDYETPLRQDRLSV